jgi:hypothetical protein
MTAGPTLPQETGGAAVLEVERFEWAAADRIEIAGRWSGLRGRRFIRPTLLLEGEGESKRLLADLEHKPWSAGDGDLWLAAFPWRGEPVKFAGAELNVGSGIDLKLPPPRLRPGKPRRFPQRIVSRDASRDEPEAPPGPSGIVTEPVAATDSDAPTVAVDAEPAASADSSAAPDPAEHLRQELDRVRADRDRYHRELDAAREQAKALRAQIEDERHQHERAIAEARAQERASATTMLAQGAELRAAVERQREMAYEARDAAEQARDDAIAARERAVADRDGAIQARKQAERDRDKALVEADRSNKERGRALAARDEALRERDRAYEERDEATKERDTIVSLHERGLPIHEPKPRFLPEPPHRGSEEMWFPRAVAIGILLIFAFIVLRLFAGA